MSSIPKGNTAFTGFHILLQWSSWRQSFTAVHY